MGALRNKIRQLFAAPTGSDAATLPVLRRLRIKFIAVNMALAALVLAGSFAAICYMDFRSDIDEVYRTLSMAASRAIERPQLVPDQTPLTPFDLAPGASDEGSAAPDRPADPSSQEPAAHATGPSPATNEGERSPQESGQEIPSLRDSDGFAPPQIGGDPRTNGETALPIAVYYCEGATVLQLSEHSTASVPDEVLRDALPAALAAAASHGSLDQDGLLFARQTVGPVAVVAFADDATASAWKSLALALALVGVAALAVLFLLNLVFSRWALRPVQQAWSQQQQFVADASHELKTPLTVILANNAILRQRAQETIASQGQWIESTQMEAERMQSLVSDMLDLARLSAATPSTSRETLDFSRLVEGEVLTFESVAFERGLTWESTVDAGISVPGDARRLERLVAVLLDNACKYTCAGGLVEVTLRAEERTACLRVRNTGEPIAPDHLNHLFDRFYRVSKARTHREAPGPTANDEAAPNGYGLGLAIARDIALAHKGTLAVTSTALEGTVFTLRIPLG